MLSSLDCPVTIPEPVTEIIHGVPITDPFRWLEDQNSIRTRAWIEEQTHHARNYLGSIPGREKVRRRIRELLDVETYDSFRTAGNMYIFRKRLAGQEQSGIYMRLGTDGEDVLLIDAATRGSRTLHTSLCPVAVSPNRKLLFYEVREGGEKAARFEVIDIENQRVLPDCLPYGFLRGFAFSLDSSSFYYVHEPPQGEGLANHVAYRHVLGTSPDADRAVFRVDAVSGRHLYLMSDGIHLGFLIHTFDSELTTDFLLTSIDSDQHPVSVVSKAKFLFAPQLSQGRIFVMTDRDCPNRRIVEVQLNNGEPEWTDVIQEANARLSMFVISEDRIVVSYDLEHATQAVAFTLSGVRTDEIPETPQETVRFLPGIANNDDVFLERESFTQPIKTFRYSPSSRGYFEWAQRRIPFATEDYDCVRTFYSAKDSTPIPIWLVGRKDVLGRKKVPVIMTSYGGFGVSVTPQFSVFVTFMMERGCVFALPSIRGGSEFGANWHNTAKRRNRHIAFDDFVSAAEWLIQTNLTSPDKLAIFGGSNSGLLVAVAATQRPELFRAVISLVPLLDMVRYHLFDDARVWIQEYGTAEDPEDFECLLAYSPYHQVHDKVPYPATMIVSGDSDQHCNSLHARKMIARLQMASNSGRPILLAYSPSRGHSPVLPFSERLEALVDRMAFLSHELRVGLSEE
jgi:prolyl oligopeptidase